METQIFEKIEKLPVNLKKEVSDFVDFLIFRLKNKDKKKVAKFGCGKGLISISSDFDEPLEDFRDYQ